MESIGMSCIKYLLFLFNLLLSLSGLAFIATGIVIKNSYYIDSKLIDDKFYSIQWLFIIVGMTIFVISFFGCCGTIRESNCMLIMFSVLLFVTLILQLIVAISGYYLQNDIGNMIQAEMNNSLPEYQKNVDVSKIWDILQLDGKCCGIHSYKDWDVIFPDGHLPKSCCGDRDIKEECTPNDAAQIGCFDGYHNSLEKNFISVLIAAASVGFIELIGCLFACCLARSIRQEYETV